MSSIEFSKSNAEYKSMSPEGGGLTTFPIRLEDKRYELATIDNMPLALMHRERDEYYPYNPVRQHFMVKGSAYRLIQLEDKRYTLEKVESAKPLSFRVQFLHQQ